MKFKHTTWAMIVFAMGGLFVAGYKMGEHDPAVAVSQDSNDTSSTAGVIPEGAQLPKNHPPLTQAVMPKPTAATTRGGQATPATNAATPRQHPVVLDKENPFTHFRVGNRNVKGIYVDGPVTWIGTSGGVIRYDTRDDSHKVYDNKSSGLLSNGVFFVGKIGDRIAAGTYGGGLSLLDSKTETWQNYNIPQGLADQFVYKALTVSNGDVWIATWSGANRIAGGQVDDPSKWETFTVENTQGGLPNPWVYGLAEGKNGDMWFATEEGLALYRKGKWQHWKHSDGLGAPYDQVKDAIQFTNDPAASSKHHARQKSAQGLDKVKVAYNPNYIISMVVDRNGIVWCGTWGGGLARFDGEHWRNFTTDDGLPANHIFMLHLDADDRLWAGTSNGLVRFDDDKKSFTIMTTADGLFADNVFSMDRGDDGSLWIGSFGGVARIAAHG